MLSGTKSVWVNLRFSNQAKLRKSRVQIIEDQDADFHPARIQALPFFGFARRPVDQKLG
jgi:hypothetical protein